MRNNPGCFNQIMNFESQKWPPVATFKSLTRLSALGSFDFQLFHLQKQVLSQTITFLGHFFPFFPRFHLPYHLKLLKYNIGIFAWYLDYLNPESHTILTKFRPIIHPSTVAPKWPKKVTIWLKTCFWRWKSRKSKKLRALLLFQN